MNIKTVGHLWTASVFTAVALLGRAALVYSQECKEDSTSQECIAASNSIDDEEIEMETGGAKDSLGFKFRHVPKKEDTGVDEAYTKLAAAMAGQMYQVEAIQDYDLSQPKMNVDMVLFDNKGVFKDLIPYFGAAVAGNTLVLGWRGTTDDIMNMITDINATPATSSRWSHISPDLMVHGGFHPIIENDLAKHEVELVKIMEKYGITEIITTGHSLGGALGTVAHLAIHGELTKPATSPSVWKDYAAKLKSQGKTLTVRNIAYSAPTSIFNVAPANDAGVKNFMKTIESTSCNIVYSTDPVPRLPGHMPFLNEMLDELIPEIKEKVKDKFGRLVTMIGSSFVDSDDIRDGFISNQAELLNAVQLSRHYGKVIYYANDASVPLILKDYGVGVTGKKDSFRALKWKETPDVILEATHNHLVTVRGPGLAYNIDERITDARLYYMHNRALMEDDPDVTTVRVNGWEDCRKKAKEYFVEPFMGGYVDWDDGPSNVPTHERGGLLHVKKGLPPSSEDADWVKSRGVFGRKQVQHTALWRTPALNDKVDLAKQKAQKK